MKKFLAILSVALCELIALIWLASAKDAIELDRDLYKADTEALARDIERYKAQDTLNVAQVGVLTMRINEYEEWRRNDAQLIAELKTKNRELQSASKVITSSTAKIDAQIKDSIVYVEHTARDTLRCINVETEWYTFNGCETNGYFKGEITNRDYILISVTNKYKRFLGFLWRTSKVKDRHVDVVSKNPNTEITGVEYIEIK